MLKTLSGRRASQNEYELRSFIKFLQDKSVSSYLEIGARHGDTFHEVMINLPKGSKGVALDLPGGLWGRSSSKTSLKAAAKDLIKRGYDIEVIFGDSTDEAIIEKVYEQGPFDAVLIDGNHLYEGVAADFANYSPLADLVAFHDIVGTGQIESVHKNKVEVPILWQEIKAADIYEILEFIDQGSLMGIGIACTSPF